LISYVMLFDQSFQIFEAFSVDSMCEVPLLEVRRCDVPKYLQNGAMYQAFSGDEDSELISVPSNTLKPNLKVASTADLDYLLSSLRFWGVDALIPEVVQFLLQNKEATSFIVKNYELNFTYLKPFKLLLEQPSTDIVHHAIECSELELLRQVDILQRGFVVTETNLLRAYEVGDLRCFKYIFQKCPPDRQRLILYNYSVRVCDANIDCYIYSYLSIPEAERGPPSPKAVLHNSVASIRYSHQQGLQLHAQLYVQAMLNTDFAAFRYLYESGCPWGERTASDAAMCGAADCLQFAHEHGCPWDIIKIGEQAVYYGKVDTLRYAHQHGFEITSNTCGRAAAYGQLEVLRYMHEQGCVLTVNVCCLATYDKSLSCLKYLRRHLCPWDATVFRNAVENQELECIKYLFEAGCPYDESVKRAAQKTKGDCRRFLLAEFERLESDTYMTVASLFA